MSCKKNKIYFRDTTACYMVPSTSVCGRKWVIDMALALTYSADPWLRVLQCSRHCCFKQKVHLQPRRVSAGWAFCSLAFSGYIMKYVLCVQPRPRFSPDKLSFMQTAGNMLWLKVTSTGSFLGLSWATLLCFISCTVDFDMLGQFKICALQDMFGLYLNLATNLDARDLENACHSDAYTCKNMQHVHFKTVSGAFLRSRNMTRAVCMYACR